MYALYTYTQHPFIKKYSEFLFTLAITYHSINNSPSTISVLDNISELRMFCLMYLNYLRVKGQFEVVNRKMFECLILIMKFNTIKAYDERDFISLRLILTLAQTCYVVTKSKEKLYLIKMFDEHSLFKDLEILCQGEPESGS
jgi:hypothetical protein